MRLVVACDVTDARSFCSTSRTRNPRPAASRAIPVPLMPPPTTARSKSAILIPFHTAWRGGLRKLKMRSCAARAIGDDAAIRTGERPMDYRDRHLAMTRGGDGGRIVNVATRNALEWRTSAGTVAYTASKAAVAAMTVALAEEVVRAGILVNAVAPSTMDTPANRKAMPKADHAAWAKVEDVAATILFLASPENRVTRGGVVPVYGRA